MNTFVEQVREHARLDSAILQRGLPVPLEEQEIVQAENMLGFALPGLFRQLYKEVANGGFGPGLAYPFPGGLFPIKKAIKFYLAERRPVPNDKNWEADDIEWPEGLLPICDWGCGRFSSLDCLHAPFPVVYHHSEIREGEGGISTCPGFEEMRERLDEHGFFDKFGKLYGNSWVVAKSFQSWLTAWINDQEVEILGDPKKCRQEKYRALPYME